MEKFDDISNLTYLNEASVLWNLKARYVAKLIYVSSPAQSDTMTMLVSPILTTGFIENRVTAQSLFSFLERQRTEAHLMTMNARTAMVASRKQRTSRRKYWYQARLWTGLLMFVL